MEQDGVGFPCVRAPQNDQIGLLELLVRARSAAGSKNRRQTDDARSVSRAVTAIYVVAAHDRPSELLRHEVHLVGRFGTTEHSEGVWTVAVDGGAKTVGGSVESLAPIRLSKRAVFSNEWFRESVVDLFHRESPPRQASCGSLSRGGVL